MICHHFNEEGPTEIKKVYIITANKIFWKLSRCPIRLGSCTQRNFWIAKGYEILVIAKLISSICYLSLDKFEQITNAVKEY